MLIPPCAPCLSLHVRRAYPSMCAVLIPPCAPCLSLHVRRAYPSMCAVLIPPCAPHFDAIPESVLSCKVPQSKDCDAFPMKMWHGPRIAARLAKSDAIPYSVIAAQIQRQTIKVRHLSYQNTAHKLYKLVKFFLTHTIYTCTVRICMYCFLFVAPYPWYIYTHTPYPWYIHTHFSSSSSHSCP